MITSRPEQPEARIPVPARYVYFERPRCPSCNSKELIAYKTRDEGDSVTRYCRCRACSEKVITVEE
jgi:DNA-directed RNA polymerase subunit RPC12/RpoP